ncbi:TIGR00282 family metallophosphoesterase [Companilactobacillus mishanensis]|uniref:TIGR00282 family metallophosphoesterase n=1 Tax=Companilactobacillus mishanensis TaxID=2486008 RepID=A0A5P0ZIJ8_9LACO|nr:TIGR00282 family metallophosphoesterase [Companilactobacillus mishanensis]MQS52913.1 TIGR00282 family metallophosphoesterase [Companilactobacillus mishanensis]
MKILFVGDVVGKIGLETLENYLPQIKQRVKPQLTIVNGENANGGKGIKVEDYQRIQVAGADVVSGGNHIWDKREVMDFIDDPSKKILRPYNYPGKNVPGRGCIEIKVNQKKVYVINMQGNALMQPIDNPFYAFDELLPTLDKDAIKFVDFHAETTSEKIAIGNYLTGRVSAVIGTHTHVQTNDAHIFNKETAYLTDVGMTGSYDGILGVKKEPILNRFLTQRPNKFEVDDDGRMQIGFCVIDINDQTNNARSIHNYVINPDNKKFLD